MKPFVHYDKLCEIYAKVKVNGERARGCGEEVESTNIEKVPENNDVNKIQTNTVKELVFINQGVVVSSSKVITNKCKKRTREDDSFDIEFIKFSKFVKTLVEIEKEFKLALNDIKKAFTRNVEISELKGSSI